MENGIEIRIFMFQKIVIPKYMKLQQNCTKKKILPEILETKLHAMT